MEKIYQSYYTNCDHITEYMVNKLCIKNNNKILEPSAGDGVFIEKILEKNNDVQIDAYDLNPEAINILKNKYSHKKNIKIVESNTLMDEELDKIAKNDGKYNIVIGNPPYGGWIEKEQRDILKQKYGIYAKETYTLFLLRSIRLLEQGGKLSFIIPDTFLFVNMHKKVREYILQNTKIEEILMFPSNFFPGVNFGYSDLCIITLQKAENKNNLNNEMRIITGFTQKDQLINVSKNIGLNELNVINITQKEIFNSVNSAFLVKGDDIYRQLINNANLTLGDITDCVTGIYCGDNKKYMKIIDNLVRNAKGYDIVNKNEININYTNIDNILKGIEGEQSFIPIIKGASINKYIRLKDEWFIDWSKEAIIDYKTVKKARFQNSQYYFKTGIGVPMVKSNKIAATLMKNRVFDQSIVGIFPKEEKYLYFLLGLLNSDIFRNLIHVINPTANSSSNYLKKVPIVLPNEDDLIFITQKVKDIINKFEKTSDLDIEIQNELNDYYFALYGI